MCLQKLFFETFTHLEFLIMFLTGSQKRFTSAACELNIIPRHYTWTSLQNSESFTDPCRSLFCSHTFHGLGVRNSSLLTKCPRLEIRRIIISEQNANTIKANKFRCASWLPSLRSMEGRMHSHTKLCLKLPLKNYWRGEMFYSNPEEKKLYSVSALD